MSNHVPESELKKKLKTLPDQLTRWRHVKTQGAYILVGKAIDSETFDPMMVYRKFAEPDAVWWVRPASEFMDGRFQSVDVFEEIKYGNPV